MIALAARQDLAAHGDRRVEWDAPDTPGERAAFGFAGTAADDTGRPAYPKVRVVTVSECASTWWRRGDGRCRGQGCRGAVAGRKLYRRLDEDWLLIADRNFFTGNWCTLRIPARSYCGGSSLI